MKLEIKMKMGVFWASFLLLAVGGFVGVGAAEPARTVIAPISVAPGLSNLLREASDLCAVAKATYSTRYGCGFQRLNASLTSEETTRLAEEERLYFGEICDAFQERLVALPRLGASEAFETAEYHLAEMKYCQPNSPIVAQLDDRVRTLFSEENFHLEVSERVASIAARRQIMDPIKVNEIIRGTWAVGSGTVNGQTSVDFRPNPDQAELRLVFNADVATRTVGTNRGVRVYSDNFGKVVASKSIFWSDDGLLTTPCSSSGSMKTRVNGFDSDFIQLLNGAIIQKKVQNELPHSERESARRMNVRVATEFDLEANKQISTFNKRWNQARQAVDADERILRQTSSRTDENRLYFSCLVGQKEQFASPVPELARAVETPVRRNVVKARPTGRYSASVAVDEPRDVVMRAHQSAPNNAAFVALSGLTLGDEGMFDDLLARFPGLDRTTATSFLETYRKNASTDENVAEREKLRFQFDDERPFNVAFDDDKVETTLRFSSFEAGGRAWPELEIKFAYKIVSKDGGVAFQRELVDVLPGGLDPNAPIPARFQAFRSVVMKRIENAIFDEYVAEKIPLQDETTGKAFGLLVPKSATARDGWFVAEFDFVETP